MNKRIMSFLGFVTCFLFIISTLQGCEPLRKKFTRQKKEEEAQEEQPILDPIDYPAKVYDPKADYKYRFSLFHVYQKEFCAAVDDLQNEKRLKYFADSALVQLEEMERLVVDDKKNGFEQAIKSLKKVSSTLEMSSQLYNIRDLKRSVENLSKPILKEYTPIKMTDSIKRQ